MSDTVFNLRYLEESQPSICIPRVFNNIDAKKIGNVFEQLQLGKIKRIDMIECKNEKGEKFKRAFVHFEKWHWNEDAQAARRKLIEGKEIKIVYDTPWFWKISANRSNSSNDSRREEGPPAIQIQRSKPYMELEDEFGRSNSMRKDIPRPVSKAQVIIPVSKAQVLKKDDIRPVLQKDDRRPVAQVGRRMDDKRDNRMRPVDAKLEVKLDVKLERKAPIAPCLSLIHPGKIAPCLPPTPKTAPNTPYQYHPPATDNETLTTAIDYGVKKPIPKRRITKKPVVLKAAPVLKLEEEVKEFLEVKVEVEDQVVEMNEEDKKICEELYGDL